MPYISQLATFENVNVVVHQSEIVILYSQKKTCPYPGAMSIPHFNTILLNNDPSIRGFHLSGVFGLPRIRENLPQRFKVDKT